MDDARRGRPGTPVDPGKPTDRATQAGRRPLTDKPQANRAAQRIGLASGRYSAGTRPGGTAVSPPAGSGKRPSLRANGKRRLPLPVVLGLMLVGGLCALLALNTASAALEVEQRGLADTNATATDNQQQLLRDLAAKEAPGSLASAAAALGLVPNMNPAFLRINANGSVTMLGSPVPATAAPVPAPAPVTSAPRPSSSPSPSTKTRPAASKAPAPAVTVTVTRLAPAPVLSATKPRVSAIPSTSPTPHTSRTAPGGH